MSLLKWFWNSSGRLKVVMLLVSLMFMSSVGLSLFTISGKFIVEIPLLIFLVYCSIFFGGQTLGILAELRALPVFAYVMAVVSFALIGLLRHGDFAAVYGDARAIILIGFACWLAFRRIFARRDVVSFVYVTCLLAALINIVAYRLSVDSAYSAKTGLAFLSGGVAMVAAAYCGSALLVVAGFACAAYLAIVSGFRSSMGITAALCGLALYVLALGYVRAPGARIEKLGRIMKVVLLAVVMPGLFYLLADRIEGLWKQNDRLYGETVTKTQNLIDSIMGSGGLNASDTQRLDYYADIAEHPADYLIPKGLGSRINDAVAVDRFMLGMIGTLDSAFYFVIYHCGLPIGIVVLVGVMWWVGGVARGSLSHASRVAVLLCAFICLAYLAISAEMLVVIFKGVPFAFLVYMMVAISEPRRSIYNGVVPNRGGRMHLRCVTDGPQSGASGARRW